MHERQLPLPRSGGGVASLVAFDPMKGVVSAEQTFADLGMRVVTIIDNGSVTKNDGNGVESPSNEVPVAPSLLWSHGFDA